MLLMESLLPAELTSSTVLENVSTVIRSLIVALVYNNRTAIRMTKRCSGAGTKRLWVAGIDIYVMVMECVLPRLTMLPKMRFRLHFITWSSMPKGLTYCIPWLIQDSTLLRMIVGNVFPSKETPVKPEPKFGPMIAILWRQASAGNGVICNHHIINMGIWKSKNEFTSVLFF